jgi:hypothetical protein
VLKRVTTSNKIILPEIPEGCYIIIQIVPLSQQYEVDDDEEDDEDEEENINTFNDALEMHGRNRDGGHDFA